MREEIIEFETPASRVIKQFSGKDEEQFRIPADLPDLTFLRALSVQGRLRYVTGKGTGTFTVVFTPAIGETIFVYRFASSHKGTSTSTITFLNDGITRDVFQIGVASNPTQTEMLDSLVGNGTKTIGVSCLSGSGGTGRVTVLGWSENTSRIRDVTI